jgi:transposase
MDSQLSLSKFNCLFPSDEACLQEIARLRYPQGIYCETCRETTGHYKIANRPAYSCTFCRHQVYPLTGTIFEKSSTKLRIWFFALYLMTHTRAQISVKQLQRELGVTYKTAWRMYNQIYLLMGQNNGDLLTDTEDKIKKWIFFNKIEIKVAYKKK